jgi:protein-S-isoprenylcysteine O-methyltransferase Ste14
VADSDVTRAIFLLAPVAVWIGLFLSARFSTREYTAALLSSIWQLQAGLIVALLIAPDKVSIGLLIGQSVTMGAVSALLFIRLGVGYCIAFSAVMLFFYGSMTGMVGLWYWASLFLVTVPSLLLASWTARASHIYLRSILQILCWACLLLWFFPNAVFNQMHGGWDILLKRTLLWNAVFVMPMMLPGFILLAAAYQFAVEGNGTGFPYDPPDRLVTKGIYAHISNPMQLGICLLMAFWGMALISIWICASAFVAVFLFVVFKDICNGSCAIGKTDPNWDTYQRSVSRWLPALKPSSMQY